MGGLNNRHVFSQSSRNQQVWFLQGLLRLFGLRMAVSGCVLTWTFLWKYVSLSHLMRIILNRGLIHMISFNIDYFSSSMVIFWGNDFRTSIYEFGMSTIHPITRMLNYVVRNSLICWSVISNLSLQSGFFSISNGER